MSAHLMTHAKCPHCPKTFSGPRDNRWTKSRIKGCLVMHIKAHHREHYVPSEASKKRALEKAGANPPPEPPLYDNIGLNPKPKRPHTKRQPLLRSADIHHMKFCPGCGLDLTIANEGYKMARGQ
jgi:hypothetical protein